MDGFYVAYWQLPVLIGAAIFAVVFAALASYIAGRSAERDVRVRRNLDTLRDLSRAKEAADLAAEKPPLPPPQQAPTQPAQPAQPPQRPPASSQRRTMRRDETVLHAPDGSDAVTLMVRVAASRWLATEHWHRTE